MKSWEKKIEVKRFERNPLIETPRKISVELREKKVNSVKRREKRTHFSKTSWKKNV